MMINLRMMKRSQRELAQQFEVGKTVGTPYLVNYQNLKCVYNRMLPPRGAGIRLH